MNTVKQIREYLDRLDEDEPVHFVVIHPADEKLIDRSFDNKVGVMLKKPMVFLKAIGTGRVGTKGPEKQTILLMS